MRHSEEETRNRNRVIERLTSDRSVSHWVATSFVRKHPFLSCPQIIEFVEELSQRLRNLHLSQYGRPVEESVLSQALELCLQRLSRTRKGLSDKQLSHFLQFARNQITSQITIHADPGTPVERETVLRPLLEVIVCEEDAITRDRLAFICRLFVDHGLHLPKDRVLEACSSEHRLFPSKRALDEALDTLRGSYEALRFLNGEFFIAPEYLVGIT
ncbi:MAG TPA: hypothetical protein PLG59_07855 [bacterium]|nr:hypothetical protein [bacterium]HQO34560.1 hypothetical protein [bacterium]HQP99148.1 hypothetical protein [bacterium]